MTLSLSSPQRPTTDRTSTRRARCGAARRAAAADLRGAADRGAAVLDHETGPIAPPVRRPSARVTAASATSGRTARAADAVIAQWLLEQGPRHAARAV